MSLLGGVEKRIVMGEGGRIESKSWKEGIVVPILKKEKRERVNHREVTIMSASYKIYVILAERNEVEKRGLIPQNPTNFKKGLGQQITFTY